MTYRYSMECNMHCRQHTQVAGVTQPLLLLASTVSDRLCVLHFLCNPVMLLIQLDVLDRQPCKLCSVSAMLVVQLCILT